MNSKLVLPHSLPLRLPCQLNYQPNLLTHDNDKLAKTDLSTNSPLCFPVQQLNTSWALSATTGAFTGPCSSDRQPAGSLNSDTTAVKDTTALISNEVTIASKKDSVIKAQTLISTEFLTDATLSPI